MAKYKLIVEAGSYTENSLLKLFYVVIKVYYFLVTFTFI